MTGKVITLQQLKDASVDADALERILNDAEWVEVETRLGRKCYTVATINAIILNLQTEKNQILSDLQDAIDIAAAAGAGANGWTASLVIDASGKNQQQINDDIKSKDIDYDKIVTVGSSGDYLSINEAIAHLSSFKPIYVQGDHELRAKILILSGHIVNEQININGIQLNWIDLSSEDAEVQVLRSGLTEKDDRWYSFIRCKNGSIPNIDVLFSISGAVANDESTGLYMNHSNGFINPYKGFKNAGSRNVDLTQSSTLCCARGIFTGAGVLNFRPATGSTVFMQFADVSGAPTGLSTSTGATVSAANLVVSNCSTGVITQCAVVDLTDAVFTNNTNYNLRSTSSASSVQAAGITITGGQYGISAENGALISADGGQISGQSIANLIATDGSNISAKSAKILGGDNGVISSSGSTIVVTNAEINNNSTLSLYAQTGGHIIANSANYQKTVGTDSNKDAVVSAGGKITAINGVGGNAQKPDVQTGNGIIVKGGRSSNSGQAVIASGGSSIVVTHGLSDTPFSVTATPNGNISPATKWWCGARTATTFTIFVDANLSSAMLFYWNATT